MRKCLKEGHTATLLTISMYIKVDDGRVESLVERITDKQRRQNGRAAETKTGRSVFTEPDHKE
jgi:hypothetical protein